MHPQPTRWLDQKSCCSNTAQRAYWARLHQAFKFHAHDTKTATGSTTHFTFDNQRWHALHVGGGMLALHEALLPAFQQHSAQFYAEYKPYQRDDLRMLENRQEWLNIDEYAALKRDDADPLSFAARRLAWSEMCSAYDEIEHNTHDQKGGIPIALPTGGIVHCVYAREDGKTLHDARYWIQRKDAAALDVFAQKFHRPPITHAWSRLDKISANIAAINLQNEIEQAYEKTSAIDSAKPYLREVDYRGQQWLMGEFLDSTNTPHLCIRTQDVRAYKTLINEFRTAREAEAEANRVRFSRRSPNKPEEFSQRIRDEKAAAADSPALTHGRS